MPRQSDTHLGPDQYVIGIEVGGRGQRVVVADDHGRIRSQARSIDASASAPMVLDTVRGLIHQACDAGDVKLDQIVRIGIAFGGPVDAERGLTLLSHRAVGFENFPFVNLIEDELSIPTVLDNDARAAALGEAAFGAARGSGHVVYVHVGTGVGGGILVDGRVLHGASSTASEIGHMVVSVGGPVCSCGKPGHLEAYAAGPSIVARFRDRLSEYPAEFLTDHWSASGRITVRRIFEEGAAGDEVSSAIVGETVQVLGLAVANLITVLNPAAVIVGGSVAEVGPLFIEPLAARVRQYSYPPSARRVRLTATQLGADTAVLGAVALAINSLAE